MFGLRSIIGLFKPCPPMRPPGEGNRETFPKEPFCQADYPLYNDGKVLNLIMEEAKQFAEQVLKEEGLEGVSVVVVINDPSREPGKENYLWLKGTIPAEDGSPTKLSKAISEIEEKTRLPVELRYKERKRDRTIVLFSIPQWNRYVDLVNLNQGSIEIHGTPWIPIDGNCDFLENEEFKHGVCGNLNIT